MRAIAAYRLVSNTDVTQQLGGPGQSARHVTGDKFVKLRRKFWFVFLQLIKPSTVDAQQ